jgi:hypothetical protein
MEIEQPAVYKEKPTKLDRVDLFGTPNSGKQKFDMREELEPVGIPMASAKVDAVYLYFKNVDQQNVALQGIKVDYKKVPEDAFFDTFEHVATSVKKNEKVPDLAIFDDGEYCKGIEITVAGNGKIGAIEFRTTKKDPQDNTKENRVLLYGVQNLQQNEDNKNVAPAPPGDKKVYDFYTNNSYLVGFYGEFDDEHITYLGAYTAPFSHINYYSRRPYILMYKKTLKDKELLNNIGKELGFERHENAQVKGNEGKEAKLTDSSTRVFYYLLDASVTNPDLFRTVLEYLY